MLLKKKNSKMLLIILLSYEYPAIKVIIIRYYTGLTAKFLSEHSILENSKWREKIIAT